MVKFSSENSTSTPVTLLKAHSDIKWIQDLSECIICTHLRKNVCAKADTWLSLREPADRTKEDYDMFYQKLCNKTKLSIIMLSVYQSLCDIVKQLVKVSIQGCRMNTLLTLLPLWSDVKTTDVMLAKRCKWRCWEMENICSVLFIQGMKWGHGVTVVVFLLLVSIIMFSRILVRSRCRSSILPRQICSKHRSIWG